MSPQAHDIAKKALYLFQRLTMLGLIILLVHQEHELFALIFCLFYWNRPEYDRVIKLLKRPTK